MVRNRTSQIKSNIFNLLLIEICVVLLLYLLYHSYLLKQPMVYGDIGIYNLNASFSQALAQFNPWTNIDAIILFHVFGSSWGYVWNAEIFFCYTIVSISMYFLLKEMHFDRTVSIIGSIFYVVSPSTILFSNFWEYALPFFFLPISVFFLLRYFRYEKVGYLICSFIMLVFDLFLVGLTQIVFIGPIFLSFLIIPIFSKKYNRKQSLAYTLIGFTFFILILFPLIYTNFFQFSSFAHSTIISEQNKTSLINDASFVFQSNNIQNSVAAMILYPSAPAYEYGYTNSWFGFIWLSLVFFIIINAINYKGWRKQILISLLLLFFIIITFEFGVYNHTLLFLFGYPITNLYDSPVFFNFMLSFIYAIFFAQFIESLLNFLKSRLNNVNLFKHRTSSKFLKILVIAAVFIILVVEIAPIIEQPSEILSNQSPEQLSIPNYFQQVINNLRNDQNNNVLILPNNITTITWLYTAIPNSHVIGLPTYYQRYPSEFVNATMYGNLGRNFADGNIKQLRVILQQLNISMIVIVNINSPAPIYSTSTTINGGGRSFLNLINETSMYVPLFKQSNYALYVSINFSTSNNSAGKTIITKNIPLNQPYSVITTGGNSCESVDINITLPSIVKPNENTTYEQLISISRANIKMINPNFSNILFYNGNIPIYAWIENIKNNAADIFLKLNGEINRTVYMNIYNTSNTFFSSTGYLGEAPQLSTTYGQYDNGANVFPFYYNFKGNTLSTSIWQIQNINYTVNNGITVKSLGAGAIMVTKAPMPNENNSAIDFYGSYALPDLIVNGSSYGLVEVGYYPYGQTGLGYYNNTDHISLGEYPYTMYDLTSYPLNTNATFTIWHNKTEEFSTLNRTGEYSAKWTYLSGPNYIGFMSNHASKNDSVSIYWIDYRTLPYNGEMPSFSIGQLSLHELGIDGVPIDNPGQIGIPIHFNDYSFNFFPTNYTWLINNTYLYGRDISYVFDEPGIYSVDLITTNASGDYLNSSINEDIIPKVEPTLNYSILPEGNVFVITITGNVNQDNTGYYFQLSSNGFVITSFLNKTIFTLAVPGKYTFFAEFRDSSGTTTYNNVTINVYESVHHLSHISAFDSIIIVYNIITIPVSLLIIFIFINDKLQITLSGSLGRFIRLFYKKRS